MGMDGGFNVLFTRGPIYRHRSDVIEGTKNYASPIPILPCCGATDGGWVIFPVRPLEDLDTQFNSVMGETKVTDVLVTVRHGKLRSANRCNGYPHII